MEMGKYMSWATSTFMENIMEEIYNLVKQFSNLIDVTSFTESHISLNTETVLWLHNIKPIFQKNSVVCVRLKFLQKQRYCHLLHCFIWLSGNHVLTFLPFLSTRMV